MTPKNFPVAARCVAALCLILAVILGTSALAQETTGGLQGTVKDRTGAAVPKAVLTLTGDELIGKKTLETDKSGYYRFENLPPGMYTITVLAAGFEELKQENIRVQVNTNPVINLAVSIGSQSEIVEVSAATPAIDVTQSSTQTNITPEQLQFEPHSRTFEGVMAFAPGTSFEPLNGGYSVSGAAYNENAYQIEGMDVGNIQSGAQAATLPTDFVENVQLLTNGYQANEGAALGGVINVAIKHGTNNWHGSVMINYEADPLDASPTTSLRYDPQTSTPTTRFDRPIQFYTPIKDHFRYIQTGFTASGFLKKDRLWATLGFEPRYNTLRRVVNFAYTGSPAVNGPRNFNNDTQTYYTTARLDGKITDKVRAYADWVYEYYRASGTNLPTRDAINGLYNASSVNSPDTYQYGIGNVQPDLLFNSGVDWTISNHLISTTRYDYFFNNYADRGLPIGLRYVYGNSSYTNVTSGGVTTQVPVKALDGTSIPTALLQPSGFNNIGSNAQYLFNSNTTKSLREDLSYFKKGLFGTHDLKFGYQFRKISQAVNNRYNTGLVNVFWGTTYAPIASYQPNCMTINTQNLAKYGKTTTAGSTSTSGTACQGNYGYAVVSEYGSVGAASENLHDFYVVDSWTLTRGVTLNLGVRDEKEIVPSYDAFTSGINFGFGSKVAPRIGGAWDVLRNGKLKIAANYSVQYDVVKLNLAIGSFGGNYWHNCTYALDDTNYTGIQPVRGADGHYCEGTGDANFAGGTVPSDLRFIENQNYRVPANDPTSGTAVDPKLMPYREHEATGTVAYQVSRNWAFNATYIRRRLDHAIEDAGLETSVGESFQIVNPGFNNYYQPVAGCTACNVQPVAARNYDGLEMQVQHLNARHWQLRGSYTYSRLRGNYTGLAQSDQSDGVGRVAPNNNRDFDEPFFQFTPAGNTFNGLLATDRPHRWKADGFYRTGTYLKRFESSLGLFTQAYSGTPLSSYMSVGVGSSYPVYVEGHGNWVDISSDPNTGALTIGQPYLRRTPWFLQTDGAVIQNYRVSDAHESWRIGFEANFTNLFNQKRVTEVYQAINASSLSSNYLYVPNEVNADKSYNYALLEGPYDYRSLVNSIGKPPTTAAGGAASGLGIIKSAEYGQPMAWNGGRAIRLTARFTF